MIGAGASGSEFAKSTALINMCSKGKLMIFDDDLIEISNLNRQFFFQRCDVGKSKAIALAQRIKEIRPQIQVQGFTQRIVSSTFGSVNWREVDLIVSAVDSRSARIFLSRLSNFYHIPTLNLGVKGLDGESHFCIPNVTKSLEQIMYETPEPAEDPNLKLSCTTRWYPENAAHCIIWAKEKYEYIFKELPEFLQKYKELTTDEFNKYLEEKAISQTQDVVDSTMRDALDIVETLSKGNSSQTLENLSVYLFKKFFDIEVKETIEMSQEKDPQFWKTHAKPTPADWNPKSQICQELQSCIQEESPRVYNLHMCKNLVKSKQLSLFDWQIESKSKITPRPFHKTQTSSIKLVHSLACIRADIYKRKKPTITETAKIAGQFEASTQVIFPPLVAQLIAQIISYKTYKHEEPGVFRKRIRTGTVYLKNKITLDMNQISSAPKFIRTKTNQTYTIPEKGFGEYETIQVPRSLQMNELVDFVLAKTGSSELKEILIVSSILLNSKEVYIDDGDEPLDEIKLAIESYLEKEREWNELKILMLDMSDLENLKTVQHPRILIT